jgi:hypothetical protein
VVFSKVENVDGDPLAKEVGKPRVMCIRPPTVVVSFVTNAFDGTVRM